MPFVRLLLIAPIAFTLAASPSAVSAGPMWCRSDPLVLIDGYLVDIIVSIPLDDLSRVTGATRIEITTPPDVSVALASPGVGFGYGEDVSFRASPSLDVTRQGMEVRIKVLVPAKDNAVPVTVEVAPRLVDILSPSTAEGYANGWVTQQATI
jgi:hypothetical protein